VDFNNIWLNRFRKLISQACRRDIDAAGVVALVVDGGRFCMALYIMCRVHTKFANFTKKSQRGTRCPLQKADSAESRGERLEPR
jgi:hypothetical protein